MKNKDITDLLLELYREVTPEGRRILDKLIEKIIFQLDFVQRTLSLNETNP